MKIKPHIFRMAAVYMVIMLLIGLPILLGNAIPERYLHYFSKISDLYQKLEAPALEMSKDYEPLINIQNKSSDDESVLTDNSDDVWLSLSEKGQGGSNVREGPGQEYPVLTVVSGEEQLLYLGDQSGYWVHIRCQDETEGWIHVNLIVGLPS